MRMHPHDDGEHTVMVEDVKLSSAVQLCGVLTLGHQWTSKIEYDLWVAALKYLEQRGSAKKLPGVSAYDLPEGNA